MGKVDIDGADVSIDWMHHLVHHGKLFGLSLSATIGAAGSLKMHIKTPAATVAKPVHFDCVINCSKAGVVLFREGDTITGGTGKTAFNYNRNSTRAFNSTLTQDSTVSAAGTVLKTFEIGTNAPPIRIGSEGEFREEFILKPSTTYTLQFTADGADTLVSLNADMYED